MAPADPTSIGREKKIKSILDFSKDLIGRIPSVGGPLSLEPLLADLDHHVHIAGVLTQTTSTIAASLAKELRRSSKQLWNDCIKQRREKNHVPPRSRLLVRARVFALLTLELGTDRHGKKETEEDIVYMMEKALAVGRLCIDDGEMDGARLALQKVADYVERLKTQFPVRGSGDNLESRHTLEAHYLILRVALSWKEDRLDVAEHMYSKTETLRGSLDVNSAEHMADTLQHIGSDMLSKSDYSMALKWLRRAYELINAQDLERLSAEGLDLRLSVCQDLIQALLGSGSQEQVHEAHNLVAYIESEIGDKPVVLHWKLEILQKSTEGAFDREEYASLLRRMIRCADLTDKSVSFLLHHIKNIREGSTKLAIGLLDELLLTRLLRSSNVDWIGKTIVRRIWMSTMQTESVEIDDLMNFLSEVQGELAAPMNPDMVGAAHSLMWKKIVASYEKKQYEAAGLWSQAALHSIFSNCGDKNIGKFGRKLILCSIRRKDLEMAKTAFHAMPEPAQNDVLTGYLMFKASLIGWDHELGCQMIEQISKTTDGRRQDVLYACIREAHQDGDRVCALAALRTVVDKCGPGSSTTASLPPILRCTIKLINQIESQENKDSAPNTNFAEDICSIFEKAADSAKRDPRDEEGNKLFTVPELEWFRKNSYNIGVTNCDTWDLPYLIRIFNTCVAFIHCYPPDIPSTDSGDLSVMSMRCHFVIATALVALARVEDKVDEQLQRYVEMRQQIAEYEGLLQGQLGSREGEAMQDLVAKMATLFVFDFEAAVCLKGWEDLSQIVRKAKPCKDEIAYKAMGDCLLRSQASGQVIYSTLRLIVNEIFALESFDNQRFAKYLRCMFQAILPLDDTMALQVVDQAIRVASESSRMKRPIPADELDWIVAATFNHAIDIYARGDEGLCQQWALKALELAEWMNDGGSMKQLLQERVIKLQLRETDGPES